MSQVSTMKSTESKNIYKVILVLGLPVELNGISKKLSWKTMALLEFSEEGQIPATLSPPWETRGLMLSKVGIIKFGNPS